MTLQTVLVRLVVLLAACFRPVDSVRGGPGETVLMSRIKNKFPDFVVNTIIDVGANKGEWSRDVRKIFPEAFILMLEATPKQLPVLTSIQNQIGNAETHIAVLSDAPNQTVSFYQGGDTGNSMFQENTKFYVNDKPVERITSTIDLEIAASSIDVSTVSILKLDIQGAEVVALQGATKALEAATFVTLEATAVDYNAGGACLFEIDQFLRDAGFYIYDFGDLAYNKVIFKSPGIGQFDILYVKPSSPHLPRALKKTKFCGAGRGNDNHKDPSTLNAKDADASYLDDLEAQLEAAVSKQNRRTLVFFGMGVAAGGVATMAMLLVAIYIKKNPPNFSRKVLPTRRRLKRRH